jgi:hypothetical protein
VAAANDAFGRRPVAAPMIERWDGKAAQRIANVLLQT